MSYWKVATTAMVPIANTTVDTGVEKVYLFLYKSVIL